MVDHTPKLKLPELVAGDYANLPLYLQTFAQAVEDQVALIDDDVTAALNRQFAVWTNISADPNSPYAAAPAFGNPFLGIDPYVVWSNYTVPPNDVVTVDSAPKIGAGRRTFAKPGIFHLTWSIRLTVAGGVTADSYRSVYVNAIKWDGSTWVVQREMGIKNMIETDTYLGFTDVSGEGVFEVDDDWDDWRISVTVQHTNAASGVVVGALAAVFVLREVGENDVIEVTL